MTIKTDWGDLTPEVSQHVAKLMSNERIEYLRKRVENAYIFDEEEIADIQAIIKIFKGWRVLRKVIAYTVVGVAGVMTFASQLISLLEALKK